MSGINVTVDSEKLSQLAEEIRALGGAVSGPEIALVMGRAIRGSIQDHFAKIAQDDPHHQTARSLGAAPTGFYEQARTGTYQPELELGGVSVTINMQGIAQRVFGGQIKAEPGHFLTIPAQAIAYGKRAFEFRDQLRLIVFSDTKLAALVEKGAPRHEGSVYYWLVRAVTQVPDPTVLPTEDEMVGSALQAARDYLDNVWGRRAG